MSQELKETLAEMVRRLRRAKAWSQDQLAAAAGISLRTVQRVETGEACAGDTLQALASALGVETSTLVEGARELPRPPVWSGFARGRALAGAMLCAPTLWFVLSNLSVYQLHLAWIAPLLPPEGLYQSPWLLLGGPFLALLLVARGMVGLRLRRAGDSLMLEGIIISARLGPALVLLVSAGCLAILIGYAFLENVAPLLRNTH